MNRFLFTVFIPLMFLGCRNNPKPAMDPAAEYTILEGETMGTYYRVTFTGSDTLQPALDSLLIAINQSVSTYIPESEISRFNRADQGMTFGKGFFRDNFEIASFFYRLSGGYYDPTVMPLVNYWGFGYKGEKQLLQTDSAKIDEIKTYIGLDKLTVENWLDSIQIIKTDPRTELDFSSVAKGYAVDILSEYLESQSIRNYLVDIGGEMRMEGINPRGKPWSIGINTPLEDASLNEAIRYIALSGKAMATSGNYRNFYQQAGNKISHTINPLTGFPERSVLLSVTILAENCALADAWATTCMVMGLEKSVELLESHPNIQACFIYQEKNQLEVKYINQFDNYIIEK